MDASNVLIVKVSADKLADLRECRDYILDSLERGVMVLSQLASYSVESFPLLGGVKVVCGVDPASGQDQTAYISPPSAELPQEQDAAALAAHDREEKQAILRRLKQYRESNGPGCLAAVAAKTRSRGAITDMILRDVLNSAVVLHMESWRKIGRALDRLEAPADG